MITHIRHLAEYGLVRVLLAVVLSLGYERSLAVARGLANLFYRIGTRQRRRALENLERAMPELDATERDRVAREAFRSFLRTFLETAWIPRLLIPGRLPGNLRYIAHPEAERALNSEKGTVLVSGHFANWELTGQTFALLGYPIFSVARTLDNPLLDAYVTRVRTRFGQGIINKKGGVRGMARVLRNGGTIGLLVDQSAGRRGIRVNFMGQPTSTIATPAMMSIRFGLPMILGRGYWTGNGNEYVVRVDEPLMLPSTGDREEDVRALTEAMNERLASWVREYPGQWLWVHRRWKMRPHWFTEAGDES